MLFQFESLIWSVVLLYLDINNSMRIINELDMTFCHISYISIFHIVTFGLWCAMMCKSHPRKPVAKLA